MENPKLIIRNSVDESGYPAGGSAFLRTRDKMGPGGKTRTAIQIEFQDGPLGRGTQRRKPNGAFVEDVIRIAIARIRFYQGGKFQCQENEDALVHLESALQRLRDRTQRRETQGVEGTHEGS